MLESWEPAAVQSQLPDELSYPPLLLFLLHIWPKWGKMASGAAVHTQPFMKCPTGALELKWEVSREKWKCFDIFMFFPLFQRSWKEPFFVISINVAFVFALLSSWGTIFLRWCSVLIRLRWAGLGGIYSPQDGSALPGVWKAFTVGDSESLCLYKLLNEIKENSSIRETC